MIFLESEWAGTSGPWPAWGDGTLSTGETTSHINIADQFIGKWRGDIVLCGELQARRYSQRQPVHGSRHKSIKSLLHFGFSCEFFGK
jgi:hypothetical protein